MEIPEISVIIPTYNRIDILRQTLQAYDEQSGDLPSYDLILVNDGSTDDTAKFLNDFRPQNYKIHVYHQKNSGPASARNTGINVAQGRYLIFTGDDIIPSSDFISAHFNAHQRNSSFVILGKTTWHPDLSVNSVMNHVDGRGAQQFSYYYLQNNQNLDFRHFYTSNVSIERHRLMELNEKFDEGFTHAAFEDAEIAYRLMGTNKKILYLENICAYHHHYYDLYSFARRQLNVGMMSVYFANKHPQAAKYIGVLEFTRKLHQRFLSSICYSSLEIEDIELTLLDVFSIFCDQYFSSQDSIYAGIFKYYYFKGIASKYFISESESLHARLYFLSIFLAYPLRRFIKSDKLNELSQIDQINKMKIISRDLFRIKNTLLLLNFDNFISEKFLRVTEKSKRLLLKLNQNNYV